jgi:hypothetical protein
MPGPLRFGYFDLSLITPSGATTFRAALASALANNTDLAALVGDRIYPAVVAQRAASQSTDSSLTYEVNDSSRYHNLAGPVGVARFEVLFGARSPLSTTCEQISEVLRLQFDGFRGSLSGVTVIETFIEGETEDYEVTEDGSDQGTHSLLTKYVFRFREAH